MSRYLTKGAPRYAGSRCAATSAALTSDPCARDRSSSRDPDGPRARSTLLRWAYALLLALAFSVITRPGFAQSTDYPSKPIRFVAGYTAGGVVDNTARVVGERLSRELNQSVIVENRAGANGQIAAELVTKSAPDGYTLLLTSVGFAYRQHLVKLPYDPLKDFTPISLLVINPLLIVVNPDLPVRTLAELIDYAKTHRMRYGTSGTGGPSHLAGELLKTRAGIDITHVPYKGDSAAIQDVLGGSVDMSVSSISATVAFIKGGRLRPIALMSAQRSPLLPDVPTTGDLGMPGLTADAWVGIIAPPGTPAPIQQKLSKAVMASLADPALREKLVNAGNSVVGNSPAEFSQFIRDESDKWGRVIRDAQIKVDE